jgi:hypothetical protein
MFEAQKLVIFASAAVLLPRKNTKPAVKPLGSEMDVLPARPALIVALPALLLPRKAMGPVLKAFKIAGPAVLEFVNSSIGKETLNVGLFGRLAWIPLPVILND